MNTQTDRTEVSYRSYCPTCEQIVLKWTDHPYVYDLSLHPEEGNTCYYTECPTQLCSSCGSRMDSFWGSDTEATGQLYRGRGQMVREGRLLNCTAQELRVEAGYKMFADIPF